MDVTYDPTVDALAITLRPGAKSARTLRQDADVRVDVDARQRVVSIEVLNASKHFPPGSLARFREPVEWLSLAEAGLESGLSPATLRVQLNKGRLKGEKRGRDWFVPRHELWTYLESRAPQGRPAEKQRARRQVNAGSGSLR